MDIKKILEIFKKQPDNKPNADEVQMPIITVDSSGKILYANTAANNLFERNNAKDINITDLIKADFPSMITGSANSVRKAFKVAVDDEKYVEISTKENTTKNYYILTFQEVTKDYILLNKLIEYRTNMDNLGKNKNIFLSQMANVFNSPIKSVIGYSRAILEGMGGETDEKQRKYLNIIYKHADELHKLLDKVTELAKVEAQLVEYSYKNYDISNLLGEIYTEFSAKTQEKGIQFSINTDKLTQKVIYGDENVLKTVISYLIDNAVYSCDFGTINVEISDKEFLEAGQKFLKIRITDPSTPAKQSEMPNLFNPYYQPDKKNRIVLIKSLNLCIIGHLIGQMSGHISAETELSGFSVVIPTDKTIENPIKVN
jgi:signal transduction histidine kinase